VSTMDVSLDVSPGLEVTCRDAAGALLRDAEPLVRWVVWDEPGAPAAAIRAGASTLVASVGGLGGGWTARLGPGGLECTIAAAARGAHGETLFRMDLRNTGTSDIRGMLLPPFSGWLGGPADPDCWCMAHDRVFMGGSHGMYAWAPREFLKDVFSAVPAPGGRFLTAVLVCLSGGDDGKEKGGLFIRPGEEVRLALHLDMVAGSRDAALEETWRTRGGYRVDPAGFDFRLSDEPSRAWVKDIVVSWLNWAWDQEVMDPVTGEYRLEASLRRAREEFGGFDVYMLWPFWPRAGFDDRFQFEHFSDMPGGRDGVRQQVKRAQALGTRIIVSYCVWSDSDRDASPPAMHAAFLRLVELALDLEADGVLMDIMRSTPPEILAMAQSRGRDLIPFNEGDPGWEESQWNLVGRIHNNFPMPRFNLVRYLLPHHPLLRVCEPGNLGKVMRNDIGMSFFSGHGVELNTMFPQKSPASAPDVDLLARAAAILRGNRACFRSSSWEPFVPSEDDEVWVNRWPARDRTLYTLCSTSPLGHRGAVLRLPSAPAVHFVDLWRHREIETVRDGADVIVPYSLEGYEPGRGMERGTGDYSFGCIGAFPRLLEASLVLETLTVKVHEPAQGDVVELWAGDVRPGSAPVRIPVPVEREAVLDIDLFKELGRHTNEAIIARLVDQEGQLRDEEVIPEALVRFFRVDKPRPTARPAPGTLPAGMVSVPAGRFAYTLLQTQSFWQATYANEWQETRQESPYVRNAHVGAFWMDRYPVTNAEFRQFLDAAHYEPADPSAFLRHWRNGSPPAGQENHPVVFVSYQDAQAYAAWAGKRLPTEEEWAWAAGGDTGRPWPWGPRDPESALCTLHGNGTLPVDAHPRGASPFGVEDMVGNVWQWTASLMDNGRHILAFLRGGSWYEPPSGMWWVLGGPRKVTDHFPLPLFGPAMNRLSSVGFRCVADA
jgi:gamma-glutamyl hercynylcysteine S-oxide synthase